MRLLGYLNLITGLFLFFALAGITDWDWFSSHESQLIVFILGIVLVGNGVLLAFADVVKESVVR